MTSIRQILPSYSRPAWFSRYCTVKSATTGLEGPEVGRKAANAEFESCLLGYTQSGTGATMLTNASGPGRLMDEGMQLLRWPEFWELIAQAWRQPLRN